MQTEKRCLNCLHTRGYRVVLVVSLMPFLLSHIFLSSAPLEMDLCTSPGCLHSIIVLIAWISASLIHRSLIRGEKVMRVFIGARPVTSLEFPRAETRHFKWQVRQRGKERERWFSTQLLICNGKVYIYFVKIQFCIFLYTHYENWVN